MKKTFDSTKTRVALAAASLVILGVHGAVFYQQFFHKWESYQTAYFDQARSLAKTDAERAALSLRKPRVEQIIVTQFGENRVDRCTTCHIGADDPRFKDYAEPLKAHLYSAEMGDKQTADGKWERRHKFSDFGCTVCHDGQGRGLKDFYAHGEDEYWTEPMLGYVTQENWRSDYKEKLRGKDYIQANCAQCHTDENFKSTAVAQRGRQLFVEKNCYGCHRIAGISNGTLGPDLSEAGGKFKVDYLWESLADPRANSATSFMPKFNLSDEDTKALVIFLKSRRGTNFAETSLDRYRALLNKGATPVHGPAAPSTSATGSPALQTVASTSGEQLIKDRACTACHKLGATDGGIAPDLSFAGLLHDDKWMMEHFKNPRSRVSDSIMPAFGFPEADYQMMTQYLTGLNKAPVAANPQELYANNCARCHGANGGGKGMIYLYLDPAPRDLTKIGFMNNISEDRVMNSLKNGVPGTSMPAWSKVFSEDQLRGVTNYVYDNFVKEKRRALKPRNLPEQNPVASAPDSIARGEQIYLNRCTGCHGRKGDGKGPNSIDILPRPRNLRNSDFINAQSDRRLFESILYGVNGSAMPPWIDYGLSQQNVGDIVNYVRSLNKK